MNKEVKIIEPKRFQDMEISSVSKMVGKLDGHHVINDITYKHGTEICIDNRDMYSIVRWGTLHGDQIIDGKKCKDGKKVKFDSGGKLKS